MLTVADDAATLIRELAHTADAPTGSGLRIVIDARHRSLSMSLAACASPGDAVVINGETRVFLSPAASKRVSARTLRAHSSPARSSFYLTE